MKPKIIGLFDSGIGGKSIEKEIKKLLPEVKTIYLADTKNFPYGEKTPAQIRKIAAANTKYLLARGADLIVVACNTATVHAISYLRRRFPTVPFVGVEPAIKPAGLLAKRGVIIFSSPQATKSKQVTHLIKKYIRGINVFNIGSLDLVRAIENRSSENMIVKILARDLPVEILNQSDVLVLGCTHFPLVKNKIQKYVGEKIKIIDSGEAIARRVKFLLTQ